VEIHGFLVAITVNMFISNRSLHLLHSRVPPCGFYCEQYCPAHGWWQISFHQIKWTPSGEEQKTGNSVLRHPIACWVSKICKNVLAEVGAITLTRCTSTEISTNKSLRKTGFKAYTKLRLLMVRLIFKIREIK
jgi:hypothetical protein